MSGVSAIRIQHCGDFMKIKTHGFSLWGCCVTVSCVVYWDIQLNGYVHRSVPWTNIKPEGFPDCHSSACAQTMAETWQEYKNTRAGRLSRNSGFSNK